MIQPSLLTTHFPLLTDSHSLFFILNISFLSPYFSLLTLWWSLFTSYFSLISVPYSLHNLYFSLLAPYYFTDHSVQLIPHPSLFTLHCSLIFALHSLLFIPDSSPLTPLLQLAFHSSLLNTQWLILTVSHSYLLTIHNSLHTPKPLLITLHC